MTGIWRTPTGTAGPQGYPVLFQDGDPAVARDFGAAQADALFTAHKTLEAGQRYCADVHARAVAHGRDPQRLKVFLAAAPEQFAGTPEQVAAEIYRYVESDACDGFLLVPKLPERPPGLRRHGGSGAARTRRVWHRVHRFHPARAPGLARC